MTKQRDLRFQISERALYRIMRELLLLQPRHRVVASPVEGAPRGIVLEFPRYRKR